MITPGAYVGGIASAVSSTAVLQHADGSLDVVSLPSGNATPTQVTLTPGALLRLSPNGTAAIAFDKTGTLVLLSNLAAITQGATVQAATLSGTPPLMDAAVSDGGVVAWATAVSTGAMISRADKTGAANQLASVGALGGMSFAAGDTLLVVDAQANSLLSIRNAGTTAVASTLNTGSLLKAPIAVGTSVGRWVVVANGDSSVMRFDLSGQDTPVRISCGFAPTSVSPTSGSGNFLLTGLGSGPVWAVQATGSAPQTYFVPAMVKP